MSEKKYTIGIDIGGSHISCVAVDRVSQQIVKGTFKRDRLSHTDTAENVFKAWAKTINECLSDIGVENVAGLGFAVPGPFNYQEGYSMMEHKYPKIFKKHIPTELSKYLIKKELPMRFLNDASSFAVGVCWGGDGKDFDRVVAITLGTGFGSAYIQGGVPVVSTDKVAPEGCFWHLPYKNGIADDYFSTRWFVNSYKSKTGIEVNGAKEILEKGEQFEEIFNEFGNNLGEFLAPWLQKFDAQILILGGNISLAFSYFEKSLLATLRKAGVSTQVVVSGLMENAAMVGAARLFEEDFWKKVSKDLPKI